MLTFNRPAFRSGVMVVKVSLEGQNYAFSLRPSDNGSTKAYESEEVEAAILEKYGSFFTAAQAEGAAQPSSEGEETPPAEENT